MKTVFITGCSTGIGKDTAKLFHDKGWNVVATMRSPGKETELTKLENVLVTKLDVIDQATIKSAVDEAIAKFGKIDVLVNNAGYGCNSAFEQHPDKAIRELYDTNVFGTMNVMREVLPHMRKEKAGMVINITSMAGLMGLPGNTVYASSKWALEGLTEGLQIEYKPLGISFKTVAPGAYGATAFTDNIDTFIENGDPELVAYSKKMREHFSGVANQGTPAPATEVADKIYACATETMPCHNVSGRDAEMLMGVLAKSETREDFIRAMEKMLLPS